MIDLNRLKAQLVRHEGLRLKPYRDTVGKLTIGVGRNLDDVGISKDEALTMLDNDIKRTSIELDKRWPQLRELDSVRQEVLVNMAFNMGIAKLLQFKKTLTFIEKGDYDNASREMLDSMWADQVGNRARELAEQLRTGKVQSV